MFGSNQHRFPGAQQQFRPPPFIPSPQQWEYPHDTYYQEAQFNSNGFYQQQTAVSDYHNNTWRNGRGHANQRGCHNRNLKQNDSRKGRGGFQGCKSIGTKNSKQGNYYCDSCDRGFGSDEHLQNHLRNEHITCGLEGCTLSAHPKVVEKHQKIQHASGLYERLKSNSSQDSDDVVKWIAERKRNYPTKENIERRREEQEEKRNRGEYLEPKKGGFKNFKRSSRGRRGGGWTRGDHKTRDESGSRHKQRLQRSSRGKGVRGQGTQRRGKGENRCQDLFNRSFVRTKEETEVEEEEETRGIPMFVGTASLLGVSLDNCEESSVEEDIGEFSDSEWIQDEEDSLRSEGNNDSLNMTNDSSLVKNEITLNNALGFLMGTYGSDSSNSDDEVPSKIQPNLNKKNSQREKKVESTPPVKGDKKSCVEETNTNSITNPGNVGEKGKEESEDSGPEEMPIVKQSAVMESKLNGEKETEKDEKEDSGPEEIPIVKGLIGISESDEMKRGGDKGSGPEEKPVLKEQHGEKEEEHHRYDKEGGRGRRCRKRVRSKKRELEGKEPAAKKTKEDQGEDTKEMSGNKPEEQQRDVKEPSLREPKERIRKERTLMQQNRTMRHPTLLEELLRDEIRQERNTILQCIRYVIENNFFDTSKVKSTNAETESKLPGIDGATEQSSKEGIGGNVEDTSVTSDHQGTVPSTECSGGGDIYFDRVGSKDLCDTKITDSETNNDSCAISEMVDHVRRTSEVNESSVHASSLSQEEVVGSMEVDTNPNVFPLKQVEECDNTSQGEVIGDNKGCESSCMSPIKENFVSNEEHLTPTNNVDLNTCNGNIRENDVEVVTNEIDVNSSECDVRENKANLEVADDVGKDADSTILSLIKDNSVCNNENLVTLKENDFNPCKSENGTPLLEGNE